MAKMDQSAYFKDFSAKFNALAYGQDDSRVFDDMLAFIIDLFSFDNPWEPHGHYTDPEIRKRFFVLFQEIVLLMNKKVCCDGDWYDPFGSLYESQIASHGRRANAGQFFTPDHIVDLMVAFNGAGRDLSGKGLNFGDPACGSGRFLIAAHAKFPGNYCCGEDIDRTCALMTVCNFILHGVDGEVIWHDSLMPTKEHFYGAWRVRPRPDLGGVPEVSNWIGKTHFALQSWRTAGRRLLQGQLRSRRHPKHRKSCNSTSFDREPRREVGFFFLLISFRHGNRPPADFACPMATRSQPPELTRRATMPPDTARGRLRPASTLADRGRAVLLTHNM